VNGEFVARRYARALYEAAESRHEAESAAADMAAVERIMQEVPGVRGYCREPHAGRAEELRFVEAALLPYLEAMASEMVRTAVRNGRIAALPFIPEAFREIREQASGTVRVLLETAHEPGPELLQRVGQRMEARLGRPVEVESAVDAGLLGGIRVSWDHRVIDLTAAGRLKALRALLAPALSARGGA
jgi:F-type H+-transporting ATPase subunit delta